MPRQVSLMIDVSNKKDVILGYVVVIMQHHIKHMCFR
jgi:hypothetical protein